jgi:aryl-alcohol dehydrogenase-like predicted oxidoreductase
MDYVKLGASGVKVSKLCLGMMSYGTAGWPHHPWVLSEADAQPFLKGALDAGINFFDTADFYSAGASEEILGNFVNAKNMKRSDAVIATKVCLAMGDGPNDKGLSRKHIMEAIDASLARLKTDYVDLLYIHRLDHDTPMEEIAEALNDVVRSGRALYLGASSMWAWQFAKLREMQRANGWARFAVMQNFYNLCYREEEREMIPYCKAEGVALVPWSPMARGFLAGNRPKGEKGATARGQTDKLEEGYFGSKQDYAILARVEKLADKLGVKPAQVALAWVLARGVTSPIIGATKPHHLSDAVAALDIKLTDAQIASLEAPYAPRAVQGHT